MAVTWSGCLSLDTNVGRWPLWRPLLGDTLVLPRVLLLAPPHTQLLTTLAMKAERVASGSRQPRCGYSNVGLGVVLLSQLCCPMVEQSLEATRVQRCHLSELDRLQLHGHECPAKRGTGAVGPKGAATCCSPHPQHSPWVCTFCPAGIPPSHPHI